MQGAIGGTRTFALSVAVGLIGLVGPSTAGAATPVGQTFAPTQACAGTWLQASSPGGTSYTMPSAGVITSWSVEAAGGVGEVALKVGHLEFPGGPPEMVVTGGTSPPQQLANNIVNTFPARVSVNAGDLLGLFTSSSFTCRNSGSGQAWYRSGNIAPGGPPATVNGNGLVQLDVSAVLEPDTDNDGFGDETQDLCPTDASKQGDCAPPDTTITSQPKSKTKKKKATFEFSGTDARAVAGFECSLNGAAFTSCASPHEVKGKKGNNTFAVRASDAAGNVDPTPAAFAWKVKKKKK